MTLQEPQRIEDIVVVVHNDDIDLFCLQLETFNTFLEPCNLHIIINERDIRVCYDKIKKIIVRMHKHRTKIWTREDILGCHPEVSGWSTQQLLKLLIPLKRSWIVFDSKDLLIRPLFLEDLDRKQRKDYENLSPPDPQAEFWQGCLELGKKFNFPEVSPEKINMNQTPRVIDNRVIRKMLSLFNNDEKDFIKWFCTFKVQGEFILYDYLSEVLELEPKLRFPKSFQVGIWNESLFNEVEFSKIPEATVVYKCHRRVYNKQENRKLVDDWIKKVIKTYNRYNDAIHGK